MVKNFQENLDKVDWYSKCEVLKDALSKVSGLPMFTEIDSAV